MAIISLWSGVAVTVENYASRGTAKPITTPFITQAAPGVVTSTSHGLSNGDFVLLVTTGMGQVNGRVFRIANVATNTFELEGETTTAYDACTGGNAYKLALSTSITTLVGVSASGGEFDQIDVTTIHDQYKSSTPGQSSPNVFTFDSFWDVSDAGLKALGNYSTAKTQVGVRIVFPNAQRIVFLGYIGASLAPTGSAGDKVTTPVTISAQGKPTVYAT